MRRVRLQALRTLHSPSHHLSFVSVRWYTHARRLSLQAWSSSAFLPCSVRHRRSRTPHCHRRRRSMQFLHARLFLGLRSRQKFRHLPIQARKNHHRGTPELCTTVAWRTFDSYHPRCQPTPCHQQSVPPSLCIQLRDQQCRLKGLSWGLQQQQK